MMSDIEKQKEKVLEIAYEASQAWKWLNVDSFGDNEAAISSDIMIRLSNEFDKLTEMEEDMNSQIKEQERVAGYWDDRKDKFYPFEEIDNEKRV